MNESNCDHLLIAGDLYTSTEKRNLFLSELKKPYTFVCGNHDYYGESVSSDFAEEELLVKASLWTNFWGVPDFGLLCARSINDFRFISVDGKRYILPSDMWKMYEEHLAFIQKSDRKVVMTHWPMSMHSLADQWKGEMTNPYFVNDIHDDEIKKMGKKLLVHGHVHTPFDYMIGDTRVICNPLGYPDEVYKHISEYHVKLVTLEV